MKWIKRLFRAKTKTFILLNGRQVEVVYSEQAQKLMSQIKDFNKSEFENKFFDKIIVGDRAILDYIFNREVK